MRAKLSYKISHYVILSRNLAGTCLELRGIFLLFWSAISWMKQWGVDSLHFSHPPLVHMFLLHQSHSNKQRERDKLPASQTWQTRVAQICELRDGKFREDLSSGPLTLNSVQTPSVAVHNLLPFPYCTSTYNYCYPSVFFSVTGLVKIGLTVDKRNASSITLYNKKYFLFEKFCTLI